MNAISLSLCALVSTLLGGLVALRHRDKLHRLLGFTAGVVLGTIVFDLLPEIFAIVHNNGYDYVWPMVALMTGFLLFHIVEKALLPHAVHEHEYGKHKHPRVGIASAAGLIIHSYIDGLGIGLAFLASPAIGLATAMAVIGHDFSDGLNTVSLMLVNHNNARQARVMLVLDAVAPVFGAATSLLWHIPQQFLVIYLGFFAGFLLYLATADILPEAHSEHPSFWTFVMTIAGVVLAFVISRIILV